MTSFRCCACFEIKTNLISCLKEKSPGVTIGCIISKHLSLDVRKSGSLPNHICSECWIKVSNFHNFYQSVEDAKEIFLATSRPCEFLFDESTCGGSSSPPKASTFSAMEIFVKTEEDPCMQEDFLQEDDCGQSEQSYDGFDIKESDGEVEKSITARYTLSSIDETEAKTKQKRAPYFHYEKGTTFQCDICGRNYKNKSKLKNHMMAIHAAKDSKCEICNATLKSEVQLKKHMRTIHSGRAYVCVYCPKTFKTKESIERHTYSHSSEPAPQIQCTECGVLVDKLKFRSHKYGHRREKQKRAQPVEHVDLDSLTITFPEEVLNSDKSPISFEANEQVFRIKRFKDAKRMRQVCEPGWSEEVKDMIYRYSSLPCVFSMRRAIAGNKLVDAKGQCKTCKAQVFVWSPTQKLNRTNVRVFNYNPDISHTKKYIRMKTGRAEIIEKLLNNESPAAIRKSLKEQMSNGDGSDPPTLISANALRVLKHRLQSREKLESEVKSEIGTETN